MRHRTLDLLADFLCEEGARFTEFLRRHRGCSAEDATDEAQVLVNEIEDAARWARIPEAQRPALRQAVAEARRRAGRGASATAIAEHVGASVHRRYWRFVYAEAGLGDLRRDGLLPAPQQAEVSA